MKRQNVKALFKSKDLRIIHKAAEVMGVPWELLIGYVGEPDLDELPMPTWEDHVTLPGIGRVRLMVGVKRQDNTNVQYCITSIDAMLDAKKRSSLK